MKKPKDNSAFIKKPEYAGGREAMQKFLAENLRYPKEAIDKKIEGRVYLTFKVEHDGSVRDVQVLKGLGHGCDEEAMRVVSLLKYSRQKNRKTRVSMQRKLHINFKLPKEPVKKRTMKYTYTESKKSGGTAKQSYSYTINIKSNLNPKKS